MTTHPIATAFRALLFPLLFLAPSALAQDAAPEELLLRSGGVLRFRIHQPATLPASAPTPVLIALAPGKQTADMATVAFDRYFKQLPDAGWVVVTPFARGEIPLLDDANGALLELADELARRYTLEDGKLHIAGVSNGGRAAFRLALTAGAARVASLSVLPGFVPTDEEATRLGELKGVRVRMFVGESDAADWIDASRASLKNLRDKQVDATLTVRDAEGHVLKLSPQEIATMMQAFRPQQPASTPTDPAVASVLDDFHAAASTADGPRYFGHFATDGVFLGTDASERWTVAEFRAYAEPYFSKGKGWTYTPRDRHITIAKDGQTAWFDEKLSNEKYGECRGSGVLVLEAGAWKIAQYNLTVPVPNDMLADVARQIREFEAKKTGGAPNP
jgi:pimeloyl-ACP methyl ester carboxylesterase